MKCSRCKVSDQIANWLEQPVLGPHAHSKTFGNEMCSDVLDLDALLYASGIPGPGRGDPFDPFGKTGSAHGTLSRGGWDRSPNYAASVSWLLQLRPGTTCIHSFARLQTRHQPG